MITILTFLIQIVHSNTFEYHIILFHQSARVSFVITI